MKTDYLDAKILSHRANCSGTQRCLPHSSLNLNESTYTEEERAEVASLEFARAAEAAQAKETVTVPNPLLLPASPPVPPGS